MSSKKLALPFQRLASRWKCDFPVVENSSFYRSHLYHFQIPGTILGSSLGTPNLSSDFRIPLFEVYPQPWFSSCQRSSESTLLRVWLSPGRPSVQVERQRE